MLKPKDYKKSSSPKMSLLVYSGKLKSGRLEECLCRFFKENGENIYEFLFLIDLIFGVYATFLIF
jgi:hypothetical protein